MHIEEVAILGARFFIEAGWKDVAEWDHSMASNSLYALCGDSDASFFVAVKDGVVIGMVAGSISQMWFSNYKLGQELFWYVHPDHRGKIGLQLLKALENDLKEKGAELICMIDLAKGMNLQKFFIKNGYRPSENTFIKRL